MADCEQIRSLLYQYIECEAGPAEAIDVANHLSSCTACKILMARKHRLGQMLEEGLHDSIPVGEEFVCSVMATLPDGPPPRRNRMKRRRGFDLAVLFGVAVAGAQAVAARLPSVPTESAALSFPGIALPSADGLAPSFQAALRVLAMTANAWVGNAPFDVSALPAIGAALAVALIAAATLVLLGSSAVVAVAASSYHRSGNA
jgi:predicted anti-sigma-YlaC factor YlaD